MSVEQVPGLRLSAASLRAWVGGVDAVWTHWCGQWTL